MVEMELFKIRIDDRRGDQLIVLKEKKGKRLLPIIIGYFEANAIKMRIRGEKVSRPLTHDLLLKAIQELGGKVKRVVIDRLAEGTFFAKLVVKINQGEMRQIDARPSDAIALALRADVPIFVAEYLLTMTGVF